MRRTETMSRIGILLRGAWWHKFRNVEGVYHKDIADDPHKMEQVNFYLEFIKSRDANAVNKILERYRLIDLSNPRHKEAKMDVVAARLDELKQTTKSKSKED